MEDGVRVHFEVSFEPIFTAIKTGEVRNVLEQELRARASDIITFIARPNTLYLEVRTFVFFFFNLNN